MDDRCFHKILDHFNLSHQGYRKVRKGVKKRLSQHMQNQGCATDDDYIALLARVPDVERQCRRRLVVSISRFFRDKRLWDHLECRFLPQMPTPAEGVFRAWSCGCARGEEAYSFRMVWDRMCRGHPDPPQLELWATDINPAYIEMARKGRYGLSSLKELPRQLVDRYFDKVTGKQIFILKPRMREELNFALHDLIEQPPPARRFDLIFLRNNLLTYHRSPEMENALTAILQVLTPGGALITGAHEKLPRGFGDMHPWPEHPWIHVKTRPGPGGG